jgi:hypothetical protein
MLTQTRQLSEREAYLAMYSFLAAHYQRGPSDAIGALLGSLSLLPGGNSTDPAMMDDWHVACAAACGGDVDASMRLRG